MSHPSAAEPVFSQRGKAPANKKCDAHALAVMIKAGLSIKEIAHKLDCTRDTVYRCCRDNELPMPGTNAAARLVIKPAPPPPPKPGSIEATGGRYAELEVYAKANKLTLRQALAAWHNLRRAPERRAA